jgi:hypothetical protein
MWHLPAHISGDNPKITSKRLEKALEGKEGRELMRILVILLELKLSLGPWDPLGNQRV